MKDWQAGQAFGKNSKFGAGFASTGDKSGTGPKSDKSEYGNYS